MNLVYPLIGWLCYKLMAVSASLSSMHILNPLKCNCWQTIDKWQVSCPAHGAIIPAEFVSNCHTRGYSVSPNILLH